MLFAIMSDIHGNYSALESVLKDIKVHKPDKIICLGDIIGYGPMPNECVEAIKENKIDFIYGNHEMSLFNNNLKDCFNGEAKISIDWTKRELSKENLKFLRKYIEVKGKEEYFDDNSFQKSYKDSIFVHASIPNPGLFRYLKNDSDMISPEMIITPEKCFEKFGSKTEQLFLGHTHESEFFFIHKKNSSQKTGWYYRVDGKAFLQKDLRYIINVGSVGQPRDLNNNASYVLFDTDKRVLNFRRVEYDVKSVCDLIISKGLPEHLGKRLLIGK